MRYRLSWAQGADRGGDVDSAAGRVRRAIQGVDTLKPTRRHLAVELAEQPPLVDRRCIRRQEQPLSGHMTLRSGPYLPVLRRQLYVAGSNMM